jgi:hypothetical protein
MIIERNNSQRVIWSDLHRHLDMMVAAFIDESGKLPSKTTLMEFMEWSAVKADNERKEYGPHTKRT